MESDEVVLDFFVCDCCGTEFEEASESVRDDGDGGVLCKDCADVADALFKVVA
jgi:hypothetical protein